MIEQKDIIKTFRKISWRHSLYQVFCDTIAMAAYSLANGLEFSPYGANEPEKQREYWQEHNERAYARELEYLKCAQRYNREELNAIAEIVAQLTILLSEPTRTGEFADNLGDLYMQLELGNKHSGQFFTPYHISRFMAEVQVFEGSLDQDIVTVSDPCVGAGGMILAFADALNHKGINYSMRMFAHCCDIDIKCVQMAYLQLSWAGIPAKIYHGNSLTLETWDVWETPAYIFNSLHFQSAIKRLQSGEDDPIQLRPVIGPNFKFEQF